MTVSKITIALTDLRTKNVREWKALKSTVFSLLNKVISLLSIILYVRWTLPYLGSNRFGVWMTLTTIIAFVNIFSDFGLGSALVNHVAYAKAKDDRSELKQTVSSAFFFLSAIAILLGIIFYFVQPVLVSSISNGLTNHEVPEAANSLLYLFLFFILSLPFIVVDKTLEGLQLLYISSIWTLIGNILSLIFTFIITKEKLGIEWLICSTVGVQSLFRIFYFFIEFKGRLIDGMPSFKRVRIEVISHLLKYGIVFFVLNIFNLLAFQIDNLLISKNLGVGNVPLFSIMQKLVTISFFFWFYTSSLWAAFADAHTRKDIAWIKKTVSFIFKLNLTLGIAFGIFILLFSAPIVKLWTNGLVPSPSVTMVLGFALYIVLNGLIGTVAIVFNTGPLLKKQILGFCLAASFSVILKVFFIKKLGIDYLMYMAFFPFLIFYVIPCYIKYRNYVKA